MLVSLFGLILFVLGIIWLYSSRKFIKSATKTIGTIIEVHKERRNETDEDGNTTTYNAYVPSIKYNANGTEYKFKAGISSRNKRKYKIGAQIKILYSQEDPQKAKVKSAVNNWIAPIGLSSLGILLIIGGFLQ